jgi:LmbE family N-acetylglucosaminyl deacetylase
MHQLSLQNGRGPLKILALGAHPDDIEIGCGGTLLELAAARAELEVTWVVFCSSAERAREARSSAAAFLEGVRRTSVEVHDHRDGFLPYSGQDVKERFEALKARVTPDVILTHSREDRHQDHRLVSDLTWNTFRHHLVLEYEIPKYDGDFGAPSLFVPLPEATVERKIALVLEHFASQAGKHWLTADLLRAVTRIRGMECAAPERHAEAFYCRKATLSLSTPKAP